MTETEGGTTEEFFIAIIKLICPVFLFFHKCITWLRYFYCSIYTNIYIPNYIPVIILVHTGQLFNPKNSLEVSDLKHSSQSCPKSDSNSYRVTHTVICSLILNLITAFISFCFLKRISSFDGLKATYPRPVYVGLWIKSHQCWMTSVWERSSLVGDI